MIPHFHEVRRESRRIDRDKKESPGLGDVWKACCRTDSFRKTLKVAGQGGVMGFQLWKRFVWGVRFAVLLACGLIPAALMTKPAAGQSGLGSGRVEGTVLDESGATVAAATITARSDATDLATVQTSDPSGIFFFLT